MALPHRLRCAHTNSEHNNNRKEGPTTNEVRLLDLRLRLLVQQEEGFAVGPVLLAFFLFVVVGSALLQIIAAAQRGPMF